MHRRDKLVETLRRVLQNRRAAAGWFLAPPTLTDLDDLTWIRRRWRGAEAYAETKFHDVLLAFAVARRFPQLLSNALEPGWVPTKMGGPGAPDDLDAAHRTQVWLATSNDRAALVSGEYFYHQRRRPPNPAARDVQKQDALIVRCQELTGIELA